LFQKIIPNIVYTKNNILQAATSLCTATKGSLKTLSITTIIYFKKIREEKKERMNVKKFQR